MFENIKKKLGRLFGKEKKIKIRYFRRRPRIGFIWPKKEIKKLRMS